MAGHRRVVAGETLRSELVETLTPSNLGHFVNSSSLSDYQCWFITNTSNGGNLSGIAGVRKSEDAISVALAVRGGSTG